MFLKIINTKLFWKD